LQLYNKCQACYQK